jgi:hypothetical protein
MNISASFTVFNSVGPLTRPITLLVHDFMMDANEQSI